MTAVWRYLPGRHRPRRLLGPPAARRVRHLAHLRGAADRAIAHRTRPRSLALHRQRLHPPRGRSLQSLTCTYLGGNCTDDNNYITTQGQYPLTGSRTGSTVLYRLDRRRQYRRVTISVGETFTVPGSDESGASFDVQTNFSIYANSTDYDDDLPGVYGTLHTRARSPSTPCHPARPCNAWRRRATTSITSTGGAR